MGCGSSVNNQVQPNQNIPQVKVSLKITDDPKFFEPVTRTINTKKPEKQLYLVFFTIQRHYEMVPPQDKTLKDYQQDFDFQLRQNEVIICQLCYEDQINQQEGQLKIVIGEGAFIIDQNQVRQDIKTILFYEGKKTAQVNIEVNLIFPPPQEQQGQNNDQSKIVFFEAKSLKLINERLTNKNILLLTIRYGDDTANIIKHLSADQEKNLSIDFKEYTILQFTNKLTPIYLEVWLQQHQGTDTFLGQAYFSIQGEQTINLTNNGDIVGQITFFSNILKQSEIIINQIQPVQNNVINNKITYKIQDYTVSYEGSMLNDEYDGKGILTCGRTKYEGSFQKGKRNGQGKLLWNDKLYYDGRWGNNTFEGNGEWQLEPEKKKRGVWVNGLRMNWRDDEQNAIYSGRSVSAGYMLKSQNQLFTMHFSNEGYLYIIHNQTKQAVFAISKFEKQPEKPYSLELDKNGQLNFRGKKGIYYSANKSDKPIESTLALFDDGRLVIQDTATLDIIWESQSLF